MCNMKDLSFNIRVYGLFIRAGKVLVTDEFRLGTYMTKFPGGGLEPGEGTRDCLRREIEEEMGIHVETGAHFYTTDFFQLTRLLPVPQQLISIYYRVDSTELDQLKISNTINDIAETEGAQSFRWISISESDPDAFTFPIDRLVFTKLKESESANAG